jgi:hypothetical protein
MNKTVFQLYLGFPKCLYSTSVYDNFKAWFSLQRKNKRKAVCIRERKILILLNFCFMLAFTLVPANQ